MPSSENAVVEKAPYDNLTPDRIIDCVEAVLKIACDGGHPDIRSPYSDGRILALNSYENRVYQVGVEDAEPLIAKFYRPNRWTDAQILEEHQFTIELVKEDIPVVPPCVINGQTLFQEAVDENGFRIALFPRRAGRSGDMDNFDNLLQLGRYLGRIHNIGAAKPFEQRPGIGIENFGLQSIQLIADKFIPSSLAEAYQSTCDQLIDLITQRMKDAGQVHILRTHGDCHAGNILWREDQTGIQQPNFVDFDDARIAPAVQDIWMLLCGDKREQELQLSEVIEEYQQFRDFNSKELWLIEPLRTLRMIHYAAWLARRWHDPAFPKAFPWFNSERYWGEHILQLKEQMAVLSEEPLQLL